MFHHTFDNKEQADAYMLACEEVYETWGPFEIPMSIPRLITNRFGGRCRQRKGVIPKGASCYYDPDGRKGQKLACLDCQLDLSPNSPADSENSATMNTSQAVGAPSPLDRVNAALGTDLDNIASFPTQRLRDAVRKLGCRKTWVGSASSDRLIHWLNGHIDNDGNPVVVGAGVQVAYSETQSSGSVGEPPTDITRDVTGTIGILKALNPEKGLMLEELLTSLVRRRDTLTQELEQAKSQANSVAPKPIIDPDAMKITIKGVGKIPLIGETEGVPTADDHFRLDFWKSVTRAGAMKFTSGIEALANRLFANDRILLIGPPGTGKSAAIEQLCSVMGWPYLRFPCSQDTQLADFVGCYEARNGATVWVDGILPRAMRGKGSVLNLDEVDHLPSECASILHPILERGGNLVITGNGGEVIKPGPLFRIVGTANTAGYGDESGRHGSAKVQDHAFLSRWGVAFAVNYLTPAQESDVLVARSGCKKELAKLMVDLANDTRNAANSDDILRPISMRETIAWAECAQDLGVGNAFALCVLNKAPQCDIAALAEAAQRHFGELLN